MTSPIFIEEELHLSGTLRLLKKEHDQYANLIKKLEQEYEEGLKEASKAGKSDDATEIIKQLNHMMSERGYRFKLNFVKRLENQVNTPYFARLQLKTNNTGILDIYVGKHAYIPDDKTYQIADWRAPVASLYYNYPEPTSGASYTFDTEVKGRPWLTESRTISGDLQLRRNIEIEHGKLLGVYDNSIRIDLLESELSKKSGGVLEDIVKTIQAEQNIIIRANPDRISIVQGTAGSGKTTVAIHRLAYLFYTFPSRIHEENTLLLSSSQVLVRYVAQTLPELEIYSLTRNTLDRFISDTLAKYQIPIPKHTLTHEKNEWASVLNTVDLVEALDRYIADRTEEQKNILLGLEIADFIPLDRFLGRMEKRTIYEVYEAIHASLSELLEDFEEEKKQGNIFYESKIDRLKEITKKLLVERKKFDLHKEYSQFLSRGYMKGYDILFDREKTSIDDACAMYYIAHALIGAVPIDGLFQHVIVDEGQELGYLNYVVIKSFCRGNGVTILGDLNQAEGELGRISVWKDLERVWDAKDIDYYDIPVSYRTTSEIITFARAILEKFPQFIHLPEPFHRHGEKPRISVHAKDQSLTEELINDIERIRKDDSRSIGIICFNSDWVKKVSEELRKAGISHDIIDENFNAFSKDGIFVVPEKIAKGLEFSTVMLIDPNESELPIGPQSARRLFVSCTRAINRLSIYMEKFHILLDSRPIS